MVPKFFEIFSKKSASRGNPLKNKGSPPQKNLAKKEMARKPSRATSCRKIFLAG
jgi:hypothetical protein